MVQTSKECSKGPPCVKSCTTTICEAESACRLDFCVVENLSMLCVMDEVNSILTQLESGTGDHVAENITAISDLLTAQIYSWTAIWIRTDGHHIQGIAQGTGGHEISTACS